MKWTYRNCDVTITTSPDLYVPFRVTPIVGIDCEATTGKPMVLRTNQCFLTAEAAEEFGQEMARDWINENVK